MEENRMIQRSSLAKGYRPIAGTDDNIILYHEGTLYLANSEGKKIQKILSLSPKTWKDRLRITVRLFRREPKAAILVDHMLFIAQHRKINLIDLDTKLGSVIATSNEGFTDPLGFCCAQDADHIVLWGEYGSNEQRESVRIYGVTQDRMVEVIHTFPAGEIRHIHSIIPAHDGGYYIFTGDNEPHAGIYHADKLFHSVQPVAYSSQQYRAVVGFDTDEGLLYATDAVNEPNFVYCLKKNGELVKVCQLNGSCIYGTRCGTGFLFSTTVEPDERIAKSLLKAMRIKRIFMCRPISKGTTDFSIAQADSIKMAFRLRKLLSIRSSSIPRGFQRWLLQVKIIMHNEFAASVVYLRRICHIRVSWRWNTKSMLKQAHLICLMSIQDRGAG